MCWIDGGGLVRGIRVGKLNGRKTEGRVLFQETLKKVLIFNKPKKLLTKNSVEKIMNYSNTLQKFCSQK